MAITFAIQRQFGQTLACGSIGAGHTIRLVSLMVVVVVCFQSNIALAAQESRQPNVVLILTDDQGWGDIRSHGNKQIHTPTLDKLAAQGARFERFYVCPVCAPTRASLLTGRYHLRTGVHGVTRGFETMRSNEITLAEALKRLGYATGIFGKWHNGAHYPYHPNGQGFDEFVGFCAGHWNNYFGTMLERNRRRLRAKGYISDALTNHALNFISKNKDRPFFCYLAYNTPHSPFQVADRYFAKYKKKGLDNRTACVYGMVENIDDNVRRILRRLDQLKLADNTIVIFLTDNGPNGDRFNGGMRGRKGSIHEGGVRVPCFVRWPGRIKPGTKIPQIAAHIDWFPTLMRAARRSRPKIATLPLDGVDLSPLLFGKTNHWPDRFIFTHRSRRGKIGQLPGSVRSQRYRAVSYGKGWQLFDMVNDPGQKTNIAKQQPKIVTKMRRAYHAWFKDVTKKGFPARTPIPIGYAKAPLVELPAPETILSGNVRYKGKSGWANDWITNWTSAKDEIAWPIDVVKSGSYQLTLMYACPKKDVGARIRIDVGGRKLEAVVRHAHDPKPLPSPDRVPRGEVYEKVWDRLIAGSVTLKKGRSHLRIRALTCPGSQVMELKAVRIQRLND